MKLSSKVTRSKKCLTRLGGKTRSPKMFPSEPDELLSFGNEYGGLLFPVKNEGYVQMSCRKPLGHIRACLGL